MRVGRFTSMQQEQQRRRMTLEALADVDAGRAIPHRAVQSYADSLATDEPLPLPLQR